MKPVWYVPVPEEKRVLVGPYDELDKIFDVVEDQTQTTQEREKNIVAEIIHKKYERKEGEVVVKKKLEKAPNPALSNTNLWFVRREKNM